MAIINGPSPYPKVPYGKPVKLGSITTGTDQLQFSLTGGSFEIMSAMGSIIFQFIANGSVTTAVVDLRASLDGGTNFAPQTGNLGGATLASTTSGLNIANSGNSGGMLINLQIPALAGQISFQLVMTSLTFNTATKIDAWVLVG